MGDGEKRPPRKVNPTFICQMLVAFPPAIIKETLAPTHQKSTLESESIVGFVIFMEGVATGELRLENWPVLTVFLWNTEYF